MHVKGVSRRFPSLRQDNGGNDHGPNLLTAPPKTDLHVHLDGSLRLTTLIELARRAKIALPSETPEGLQTLVFRSHYANLEEYLEGFNYTVAALCDGEALERAAFELAEDCQARVCATSRCASPLNSM